MNNARVGWALLLAGTAALAALQLWQRPLLPVDETRYLSVAWEMWWRGEFLVPWLNGEPYSHKPPLLFWLIHAAWALFGVSETAARLVPVLLSLLVVPASMLLARRLWPQQPAVAVMVPWLLFGGLFWANFFTLVQFDFMLVLSALLAWLGVITATRHAIRGWLLLAAGIGLGVLAKGPVILVPVLPAVLFAPWWRRDEEKVNWTAWYGGALAALLLGAGLALAWAIPAAMAGGELYREAIFWGQTAGRLVSSFAHRSPWWSYLLWLPLMLLPWAGWPALWRAVARRRPLDTGSRFCIAVVVPALLVFSLISGKQGKYLLPLFPLLAMYLAHALVLADMDGRTWHLRFMAVLLACAGGLLVGLPWSGQALAWTQAIEPAWGAVLIAAALVAVFVRSRLLVVLRAAAIGSWLLAAVLHLALAAPLTRAFDLQPLSAELRSLQDSGHALAWLGKYHGQFQFLGRLTQPVEPLVGGDALMGWLQAYPDGYVLVNYKALAPDVPATLEVRPYRGGSLVVWPAGMLLEDRKRLDALIASA